MFSYTRICSLTLEYVLLQQSDMEVSDVVISVYTSVSLVIQVYTSVLLVIQVSTLSFFFLM